MIFVKRFLFLNKRKQNRKYFQDTTLTKNSDITHELPQNYKLILFYYLLVSFRHSWNLKTKKVELRKVFFLIYISINIAFDTCMLRNLNIFTFVVRKYLSRVINGVWMGNSIFSLEIKIDSVHDGSNLALPMNNKRPAMQLKFIFMANCMDKVGKLIIILIIHSFVETIRREIIYSFI